MLSDFHFQDDGGSLPAVVLLHGFMGSLADWDDLRQRLRPAWRTVAIDLPGHGQSPLDPGDDFQQTLERLESWLRQSGLEKAHLLGYSMGGRLALGLALRAPQLLASLILESVSPGLESDGAIRERQAQEAAWAQAMTADKGAFLADWNRGSLFSRQAARNPQAARAIHSRRLDHDPRGWADALKAFGLGYQPNLWSQLPHLDLPVLLLSGREDEKFTHMANRMAGLLPGGRKAVISDAGHAAHLEQPAKFQAAVSEFLAMVGMKI
ncbi:MAG: 2-succinyl-6-hydroxy-2,4-cyclohexadiene-1-carboxylate synthase [Candidatus Marinimicrobia bacterium]|nr:2-succinyl-6-hydroxy-2,4-cyclohexadiene-1-carboxylate synthase [Candidatus Neomarinimicrobiota bacterium]